VPEKSHSCIKQEEAKLKDKQNNLFIYITHIHIFYLIYIYEVHKGNMYMCI